MNEATQTPEDHPASLKGIARMVGEGLDGWVFVAIADGAERRRHALAIGSLIALGLASALASPVLAVAQAATLPVIAPLVAASLLLTAAAALSVTGAFETFVWGAGTLLTVAVGWLAVATGSPEAFLPLLAILPVEALARARKRLAAALAGSAVVVAFAAAFLAPRHAYSGLETAALAILCIYLATLALRVSHRLPPTATGEAALPAERSRHGFADTGAALRLDADGVVAGASNAAARLLCGDERAWIAGAFIDRVHVADRIDCLKAAKDAGNSAGVPVFARLRRADGSHVDTALTFRMAAGGETIVELLPIAARPGESAAETLRSALEEATQSSIAKTQFLAAVSHELRTPLNAIIGFSDILGQEIFGGFETERQKEYVGLIRQSGQHLLSVVNGLLDVSKIEAGRYELQPESFVLGDALAKAADIVRDEAKAKKLRLDLRAGCGDARITADQRACHQILLNLLSNAIKFTDVGVVTLESRLDGAFLEVAVSDTGIGIASEDVERLGRPFTQVAQGASRRYTGTGLGLSLVKGLAELHGGTMTIASQPSIGTMVTVRLPLDCTQFSARKADPEIQENVVALEHARTKAPHLTQTLAPRRSA